MASTFSLSEVTFKSSEKLVHCPQKFLYFIVTTFEGSGGISFPLNRKGIYPCVGWRHSVCGNWLRVWWSKDWLCCANYGCDCVIFSDFRRQYSRVVMRSCKIKLD